MLCQVKRTYMTRKKQKKNTHNNQQKFIKKLINENKNNAQTICFFVFQEPSNKILIYTFLFAVTPGMDQRTQFEGYVCLKRKSLKPMFV